MSWVAGWDDQNLAHYGYANLPHEVAHKLLKLHLQRSGAHAGALSGDVRRAGTTAQGPFPFPLGFIMGLSSSVVRALGAALARQPRLQQLTRALERKAPSRKCAPEPDSGLGYLLAQLDSPLTFVDVSSTARMHFWRTRATARALADSLAIMHGAKEWEPHFRWAACTLARTNGRTERSRATKCGPQGEGHRSLRQLCAGRPQCAAVLGRYWGGNISWCQGDFAGAPRVRPSLVALDPAICNASAPVCPRVIRLANQSHRSS